MIRSYLILVMLFFALFAANSKTSEIVYLSGAAYNQTVDWDFFCSEGQNSGAWKKIPVPSQWETAGFGNYTYGRWYKQQGKSPSQETGHYKTTFTAPQSWKNQIIKIVFEGVMTDTKVLVNGKQVGDIHQGSFYQFSYDITKFIDINTDNTLEVIVSKHSADNSVNAAERKADWWLFGGIYRPVYLEVLPQEHIKLLQLNPTADGTLTAEISHSPLKGDAYIAYSLQSVEGKIFPKGKIKVEKKSSNTTLTTQWEGIKAWTPEHPQLYNLTISLIKNKQILHSVSERIGFRTIEVKPQDGLYCNGTKVVLKGINRHTFWPESGRCTGPEVSRLDAQLIKDMNMNAVRCHYPPDEHFLDMCDSIGLFFIDELAGWQNAYRTSVGSQLVKEMIQRDMNHPSVIMWSNGNEGGWNYEVDHLFEKYDIQRRDVIHPWSDFDDIDTHHYPQYQTGLHRFNNGYKIFMPTEFLHGLYDEGHGAGLYDFWSKWTTHPMFAGGFLWAFNDGAVIRTDLNESLDSDGQHAPDGVVGPYREKEGSYFTIKEIWSPLQVEMPLVTPDFNGEFYVSNKFLFTNLKECRLEYAVQRIPSPWNKGQKETIAKGKVTLPDAECGETRKVRMEMPDNFANGDLLLLSAYDPYGNELYTWSWPIRLAKQYLEAQVFAPKSQTSKASYEIKDELVTLSAAGTKVIFNSTDGLIKNITTTQGEFPFKNGPIPVGMKAIADHYQARQEGNTAVFTVWYKGGIDSIRWEMHPDGKLKMAMLSLNKATNDGGFDGGFVAPDFDVWGITFSFDEDKVEDFTWMGKGPYRVWKNRQRGTTLNLWNKEYNNTITGESFRDLRYPEYKGYHANVYWGSIACKDNIPLTFASESDGLYFRLFTPEEPKGSLKRSLPHFPEGDISFLYEINAIHAFKPTSQMGPNSEPTSIRIKKGDEGISMILWFDFGKK